MKRRFLTISTITLATWLVLAACGDNGPGKTSYEVDPDDSDAKSARDSGVSSDDTGSNEGTIDPCADKEHVCTAEGIRDCKTGDVTPCGPGFCVETAGVFACATKGPDCKLDDGSLLLCATSEGDVDTTRACDVITGQCQAVTFDCSQLAGEIQCPNGKDYLSNCVAGQPVMLACSNNQARCGSDQQMLCVAEADQGSPCGQETVCKPGAHCVQQTTTAVSRCDRPAGMLACSSSDVLAVCTDVDTAFVCIQGFIFEYQNLTSWGGRCDESSNRVTVPLGGNCFPGLVDCGAGLKCEDNVVGKCIKADPNAAPECTLTEAVGAGHSCNYSWDSCANGNKYRINCVVQGIAGTVWSDCDCNLNGSTVKSFTSTDICSVDDTNTLDALAKSECGWAVSTVGG